VALSVDDLAIFEAEFGSFVTVDDPFLALDEPSEKESFSQSVVDGEYS
jgi:hypothetical protein